MSELDQAIKFYQSMLEEANAENHKLKSKLAEHRMFLNALRLSHDLDVPEEVWSALFDE